MIIQCMGMEVRTKPSRARHFVMPSRNKVANEFHRHLNCSHATQIRRCIVVKQRGSMVALALLRISKLPLASCAFLQLRIVRLQQRQLQTLNFLQCLSGDAL